MCQCECLICLVVDKVGELKLTSLISFTLLSIWVCLILNDCYEYDLGFV